MGWGWLVKFNHDFIGRSALEKIAVDPPRKLVSLEWNDDDVIDVYASQFTDEPYEYMEMPRERRGTVLGCTVYGGDREVGCAVSRCYSPWFKKTISFAFVDKEFSNADTDLTVKWGSVGKRPKMIRVVSQRLHV